VLEIGRGRRQIRWLGQNNPNAKKETTMNDNDARLTRVFTALTGSTVEEDIPNMPDVGEPADTDFDVFIEGAAGNNVGSSATPYTLTITGVNVTKQVVVPQLSSVQNQAFNAASGWVSSGDDFVKTQNITFPLPLPAPSAPNDLYRFYVSLVTPNFQIASLVESNLFMLV
jgi:hypothetical protein